MSREIIMYIAISQLKPKRIHYILLDFIFKVLSRNMRIKSQIMSYRLINPQQRGHQLYTFSNLLYICTSYRCTSVKTKHNLGKIILFQPLILGKIWLIVTKKKLNIKIQNTLENFNKDVHYRSYLTLNLHSIFKKSSRISANLIVVVEKFY